MKSSRVDSRTKIIEQQTDVPAETMETETRNGSTDKLLYLLKTRGSQTAPALAEILNMTSMGARKLLQGLQQRNLVSHYYDDCAPGKPKQYWTLTEAGQARFPDRHSDLTLELIEQVRNTLGEQALERLISHREQEQTERYLAATRAVKTLRGKLARLVRLRTREGYMAQYSKLSDGAYLLVENHCPNLRRCNRLPEFLSLGAGDFPSGAGGTCRAR